MTNPPSVPSLDVEACVRLLDNYRRMLKEKLHRCSIQPVCHTPYPCSVCHAIVDECTTVGALASALPGMGKALDLVRDCPRCQGYLRSGRLTLAQSEREAQSVLDRLSAARAAQPQETSADAE